MTMTNYLIEDLVNAKNNLNYRKYKTGIINGKF